MTLLVGTSGWQYAWWRERFYPRAVPQRRWLPFYAERFACVEVNNTFYSLPERSTFERWAEQTPEDFVFALKLSRYLTHIRRLRDPQDTVRLFLERAAALGPKLGPLLLQLPPSLHRDLEHLEETLRCFPPELRVAVEFRHPSWYCEDVFTLLSERNAALCLTDRAGRPLQPLRRTSTWGFVRLHEGRATPRPCYGDGSLRSWLGRIASLWSAADDVYLFFNNDGAGCAVSDAVRIARRAERLGLRPSRVPRAVEVRSG